MQPGSSNPNFTTDRPVAVLMVFLAAVVFGYFSLGRLPVTLMPEMSYPTLTVRTEYPGAAPEEVENDISRPIEEQLGVVSGLNEISSISRAGVSDVVLEFVWGASMVEAIQNTLEKLDTVYLPRTAEKPLLLHYDPSLDPIMELSLSTASPKADFSKAERGMIGANIENAEARRLRRIAELQVKRALEPIKGVAGARVRGGLEEEIHVLIEAAKLQRANISIGQVLNRLRAENINSAGGRIREGEAEYMIRTINEYENLEEIADTVVLRENGREIRLKDLGQVVYGQRDREMLTRTNGGESVQIDVYKEADSNMIQVADRIKSAVGSISGSPIASLAGKLFKEEQVVLQVVADRSVFIANSIREVKGTAVAGGCLAVLILLIFLRDIRTTSIIAVSIPISIFATFAPLNLLGVSLNIMSLGGLAMGVGMLVDSSIVVLESIHRCREEGDPVREAAIRGAGEVRGAVIASTLTSICVFFPMVFVEGLAGQVFGDLGLTVVTSLIASLIVAILFIPMLASRTGYKVGGGAGVMAHPLLSSNGYFSPTVFLLRILLPMIGLLAGITGVVFAWQFFINDQTPGRIPNQGVESLAWVGQAVRVWAPVCVLPFGVSLSKVRLRPEGSNDLKTADLWTSFRLFRDGCKVRRSLLIPAFPYFFFRLLLSFWLELLGLSLVWLLRALCSAAFSIMRSASLVMAFFRAKDPSGKPRSFAGFYTGLLNRALNHPWPMLLLAAFCVGATYLVGTRLETELLPEVHQSEFTFEVALPVGTPLDRTIRLLDQVEERILKNQEELNIETLLVMYGFDPANMKTSDEGEHSGRFKVILKETQNPRESEDRVILALRAWFQEIPDVHIRVTRPVLFSSKKPVVIQINGEDLSELKRFSDEATALFSKSTELADVEPTLRSGAPEVQIAYDRHQIIRHGLTIESVAGQVRDMVKGSEATRLNRRDRRVPIVVRLAEKDREQVSDVGRLTINPGSEIPLPLNAIAEMSVGEGPSEIRRIDGNRVALIQANIGGASLGSAAQAAQTILEEGLDWPVYMDFLITGQNQEWERSRSSLYLALSLSLFLVYVIMASQFESLLQPFIIMFTIPLAFVGTVVGLKLLGINLSVVVFLGLIMLAGIVVNNAIVLVDYTNTLIGRGIGLKEAILQSGRVRLRPILMTTATTVLGLFPMALGMGDGAEIRRPMAVAVICGLLTSTLLTLLIIPALYYLLERARLTLFGGGNRGDLQRS